MLLFADSGGNRLSSCLRCKAAGDVAADVGERGSKIFSIQALFWFVEVINESFALVGPVWPCKALFVGDLATVLLAVLSFVRFLKFFENFLVS